MNRELVTLYWQIGWNILARQLQRWGSRVIDQLARDLKAAFPDMKGFAPRNLNCMRALAQAWPESEFVQRPVAQLPWSDVVTLLDTLDDRDLRNWYAHKLIEPRLARTPEPEAPLRTSRKGCRHPNPISPARHRGIRTSLTSPT